MKRACKTEINPTLEQKKKINQSIGICRWLYNSYLAKNKELYDKYKNGLIDKKEAFISANNFDKYINNEDTTQINATEGIGIDIGVKDFAICSNGLIKKNINKTKRVKDLEKKLKREQRRLSKKYESLKLRNKNIKEGKATRQNIRNQIVKVQKLHQKLLNIRTDYINKTVNEVVKQKPSFITIEDLNIKGMMKNRHLSKLVAQQKFYEFRTKLTNTCKCLGIELRVVDRFILQVNYVITVELLRKI